MDQLNIRERITELYKKYRYAVLIVLIGIALMCIPGRNKTADPPAPAAESAEVTDNSLQQMLSSILSQIKGAGKVEVLLTEARGAETIYQTDTQSGNESKRQETVIISGSDRAQIGLVRQVNPPSYLGAIVVCQGADNASVRLAIVQAVSSVTGLGADHITVLKMK